MYYLFLLATLVLSNINSFSTNFIQSNSNFLNSTIKKIQFDYSAKGFIQLGNNVDNGIVNLMISDTCYKASMVSPRYSNTIISNGKTQKSYNTQSNQIFIENANFKLDSLILNFFNNPEIYFNKYFSVDTSSDNIIESIGDVFKVKIFTNNYAIDSVIIIYNEATFKLFNVKLSEYNNDIEMPFNINKPNAFILDLRD